VQEQSKRTTQDLSENSKLHTDKSFQDTRSTVCRAEQFLRADDMADSSTPRIPATESDVNDLGKVRNHSEFDQRLRQCYTYSNLEIAAMEGVVN
jgi:hypothetical protein